MRYRGRSAGGCRCCNGIKNSEGASAKWLLTLFEYSMRYSIDKKRLSLARKMYWLCIRANEQRNRNIFRRS